MKSSSLFRSAFALSALASLSLSAQADVLVSNLSANNAGYTVASSLIGQAISMGSQPISLSSVVFPQREGTTVGQSFSVYSRNSDGTLGSVLDSAFGLSHDATTSLTTATITAPFTLQANTSYFLALGSTTGAHIYWDFTFSTTYSSAYGVTLPTTRTVVARDGSQDGYYNLSDGPQLIQVNGTVQSVPEPASMAALGLGALALVKRRRKA